MAIDLAGLTPAQLTTLIAQAGSQMAAARATEIQKARVKIDAILSDSGLRLDDVFPRLGRAGGKVSKRTGARVPKYRNPKNATETWSGMGKRPRWLAEALAKGAKLETFLIPTSGSSAVSARKGPVSKGVAKPGARRAGAVKKRAKK